jgi:hypothetical protein
VKDSVPVDSDVLLVTDFVNLKIKPTQSFRRAYRNKMYIRVFIEVYDHMCINIYVYIMFIKKKTIIYQRQLTPTLSP